MGVALFAGLVGWAYVAAHRQGGDAGQLIALVVAAGSIVVITTAISRSIPFVVPLLLIVSAAAVWVVNPDSTLSSSSLAGPFGYTNATASFFLQASLAAVMLVAVWRRLSLRIAAAFSLAILAIVPILVDSRSAVLLLIAVPALALGALGTRGSRAAVAICGLLLVTGVAATMFLGATYDRGNPSVLHETAASILSERRIVLWHDATELIADEPFFGVGPSRFDVTAPTAIGDADARWAHNEFLQVGAEIGLPGLVLMLALFGWAFWRLWSLPIPGAAAATGAVAIAVLGLHACIDFVLHFPAVPVAAAALLGSAVGATQRDGEVE